MANKKNNKRSNNHNKKKSKDNYDYNKPFHAQDLGDEWDDFAWTADDF